MLCDQRQQPVGAHRLGDIADRADVLAALVSLSHRGAISMLLASNFPLALAAPASDAFHGILPRRCRNNRREFAARQLAFLEVARRSEAIVDARRLVGPHHRFLLAGELQRVAPAATVAFVDLLSDLGADHRAEHGADDDRDRAVFLVGGARTDYAAERSEE